MRSRIVPDGRHNIVEVLRANGLVEYDEVSLLAISRGRSSDDDFLAYEVTLPDELAHELAGDDFECVVSKGSDELGPLRVSKADRLIAAVERKRIGVEVQYACVGLPDEGEHGRSRAFTDGEGDGTRQAASVCSSAKSIGDQIREQRKMAGLTQSQLAARAGITQTVLSRIESGSGNPTLALLEELAFALDMRLTVALDSR